MREQTLGGKRGTQTSYRLLGGLRDMSCNRGSIILSYSPLYLGDGASLLAGLRPAMFMPIVTESNPSQTGKELYIYLRSRIQRCFPLVTILYRNLPPSLLPSAALPRSLDQISAGASARFPASWRRSLEVEMSDCMWDTVFRRSMVMTMMNCICKSCGKDRRHSPQPRCRE